jgi:hypothetical protein
MDQAPPKVLGQRVGRRRPELGEVLHGQPVRPKQDLRESVRGLGISTNCTPAELLLV